MSSTSSLLPSSPPPQVPAGWVVQWSPEFRCYFYANEKTGLTQWEAPGQNWREERSAATVGPPAVQPPIQSAQQIIIIDGSRSAGPVAHLGTQIDSLVSQLVATTRDLVGTASGSNKNPGALVSANSSGIVYQPVLPAGWTARWSSSYQCWYFVHMTTGVSQWTLPLSSHSHSNQGVSVSDNEQGEQLARINNTLDTAAAHATIADAKADQLKAANRFFLVPIKPAVQRADRIEAEQRAVLDKLPGNSPYSSSSNSSSASYSPATGQSRFYTTPDGLERDNVEEEIDETLDEMALGIGRISQMARQMNSELGAQKSLIADIHDKTIVTNEKVALTTQKINRFNK
ncbi:hypothetical protein HK100_002039 [Physocladia obscura]|uniref:Uncharacterized protein n=1 Tax=Physocladia obscura TaxID=109957 RepID=A0AAD5XEG8_9FUNG|nr:hypothetical protein HK100_002039 [Physocladia obscura]